MIKRLKKRYLITNMALLSSTLLLSLAILFGILYHAEVAASYTVMQEMMKPAAKQKPPPDHKIETEVYAAGGQIVPLSDQPPYFPPYWPPYWPPWWIPADNPYIPGNGEHDDHGQDPAMTEPPQTQPPQTQPPQPPQTQPPQTQPPQTQPPPPKQDHQPKQDPQPVQTQPPQIQQPQNQQPQIQPPQDRQDDPPPETDLPVETETAATSTQTTATEPVTTVRTTQTTEMRTKAPAAVHTETKTLGTNPPPAAEPSEPPTMPPVGEPPVVPVEEGFFVPDAFVAEFDENGNIKSYAANDPRTSDEEHFRTVHEAVREVRQRGASSGTLRINDKHYRFLYKPDEQGHYRLILLDRTLERSTIRRLIFIFAMIAMVGMMIVFFISWKLANWTVTPIAVAWEKQKQFVADASHELKTPLAVIAANTEVILSNPQESVSGQSKWLSYIQSETMRMSKLITNLLSVARMDSGKQQKEHTDPLSLSDAVSNICLVFEPIVYENGKKLTSSVQEQILIQTDEDNIKQLLSILLDNAVLHSVPQADIFVSLSQTAHGKIILSVANTAKNIPQEQLVHLFDRFYRVDTEGSPNGSGLGLSIAKSIVRQMGGEVRVTSENELFTFTAELPAA